MDYLKFIDGWNDFGVTRGKCRVEIEWLGEGLSGDWDKDDPEDYPHLRFSVYKVGFNASKYNEEIPCEAIDDASYCTMLSIATPRETLEKVALYILYEVKEEVESGHPIKKLCEKLSWIDESWIKDWIPPE